MAKAKMGHAERASIAAVRGRKGRKRNVRKREARESELVRRAKARIAPLVLSAAAAAEFVKLNAAGLPYALIFHYLAPEWWQLQDDDARERFISLWLASPLVARAAVKLNGGLWQDLDKDTRIEIALDKHASQLAFLLYNTNPNDVEDKLTLDKIRDAREALFEMQRLAQGGEQGAFAKMVADLLAGKVEGQEAGPLLEPPRESDDDPSSTGVPLGTSVPVELLDRPPKGQLN